MPDLPTWWVVLFYLGLIPAFDGTRLAQTLAVDTWPGVLAWSLITCWLWWGPSTSGSFRCTFLAVGHGGCTVIETSMAAGHPL